MLSTTAECGFVNECLRLPVTGSSCRAMKRLSHCANLPVLENHAFALAPSSDGNIHHCPRQVVGANHLIGEQHPKRRVDRTQQPVAEVRFLPGFDGIDIGGPEDIKTGETVMVLPGSEYAIASGPRLEKRQHLSSARELYRARCELWLKAEEKQTLGHGSIGGALYSIQRTAVEPCPKDAEPIGREGKSLLDFNSNNAA